ncbi:glutamate-cysteine ligase family protein [Citroniella saccharovorans]|uniref:glutamate-cysteine ligase family protein n=1 Tax=Citroniella saccharovorans TaxID=2053367 RepID=UPI002D76A4BB|nr:glutamate-cysteine ligase family protein [Citroniella saccharovorans]
MEKKKKKDLCIGVEFEHFAIDNESLETKTYHGKDGVGESLEEIGKMDSFMRFENDGYLLGLTADDFEISTEPAGQFEISISKKKSIKDLEKIYLDFMRKYLKVFKDKNQSLVAMGYHPNTSINDFKISPKKRYEFMFNYFKDKGTMAHNMMKGTSSVQVTIDYLNEKDFVNKYKAFTYLSPILYALFDNSYIFEKKPLETYAIRQEIWENTDLARSGVLEEAFLEDFSYEKYAEYILNNNTIFIDDEMGLRSTENKLFKEIFDPEKEGTSDIFHAISIVFPDVRLKRYIEIRMMDAVPYPLNFSIVTLIKALAYKSGNIEKILKEFKGVKFSDLDKARGEIRKKGINAKYYGKTILEWGKFLYDLAENSLDEDEKPYLKEFKKIIDEGKSPREKFKEIYEEKSLKDAVESEKINV